MIGVSEVIFVLGGIFLGLAVPSVGLYLVWRINLTLADMASSLAALARDRQ